MSKNKDNDELLRAQINALIHDEIQEGINDYLDDKEANKNKARKLDLVLLVQMMKKEVNLMLRYVYLKKIKRIKKQERSAFGEIKKLGLVDKNGQPLENKKEEDVKDNKKGITGTQTFKN